MYITLLALHSLLRWLVLSSLLFAIIRSYRGLLGNKPYSKFDNTVRHTTATIAHVQLLAGVWLYFISPIVAYFLHNFKTAMHIRDLRFFGMEHITMMLTGIVLISLGSAKAKRTAFDKDKFRIQAIWFTIGLLVILSSVPWAFSPLISRPWFRSF
jgi:hypothetical protein